MLKKERVILLSLLPLLLMLALMMTTQISPVTAATDDKHPSGASPDTAPVAQDDVAMTDEDTAVSIPVLDNDSDIDSVFVIDSMTDVDGTAIISGTAIIYTPTLNFSGDDVFSYVISDGALMDTATVTVTITSINDAPVAVGDSYTVTEEDVFTEPFPGVLDNDTDAENDELTAVLDSTVISGVLMLALDGSFVYTPADDFCGTDWFSYHANDNVDDSNSVVVTLNVTCHHDLIINLAGTGNGIVSTDLTGADCVGDCSDTYDHGVVITLTAVVNTGYFTGWSGACDGMNDCVVTMDCARNVTATFSLYHSYLPVIIGP